MYKPFPDISYVLIDVQAYATESTEIGTNILSNILLTSIDCSDQFSPVIIDYKDAATTTFKRYFLDNKYRATATISRSWHPGTVTLQFYNKLSTQQPLFNIHKTEDARYYKINLVPSGLGTGFVNNYTPTTFYEVKKVEARQSQQRLGEYAIGVGTLVLAYQYKEFPV